MTEWLFDEVVDLGGGDARSSPVATRQLLEAARAARERLSDASETEVELTFADGNSGHTTLTRWWFWDVSPFVRLVGIRGCFVYRKRGGGLFLPGS